MRQITARQMWHDAYYTGSSSPLAEAREIGLLGVRVQKTAYHNSTNPAAHIAQC